MALKKRTVDGDGDGDGDLPTETSCLVLHDVCDDPPTVLSFLKLDEELVFRGIISLRVLLGCVWMNGFMFKPRHNAIELHSPNVGSCLVVKADDLPVSSSLAQYSDGNTAERKRKGLKRKRVKRVMLTAVLPVDCDQERISEVINNSGEDWMSLGAVVLLQQQESFLVDFITRIDKQFLNLYGAYDVQDQQAVTTCIPRFQLNSPTHEQCISISSQWEQSAADILKYCMDTTTSANPLGTRNSLVIVMCGAKNSGKSTYSRFLANTFLNKYPQLTYLEADVGQTEFMPPGFVGLNLITKPITGPAFTHQFPPLVAHFFGDVSPKSRPGFYLQCVSSCYWHWNNDKSIANSPLLVNTCGWVKGLGILLLADILRIVKPTHIVQLQLRGNLKNAPAIDFKFLRSASGWRPEGERQRQWPSIGSSHPIVYILDSCTPSGIVDQPTHHRLLALLAEFTQMFKREHMAILSDSENSERYLGNVTGPLSICLPYKVSWKFVAVCVLHEKVPQRSILYSLNSSVVGLAIATQDMLEEATDAPDAWSLRFLKEGSLPRCIGLGIIRAIDEKGGHFYVSTALTESQLQSVNCLLKGNLEIPLCLLFQGTGKPGVRPYVSGECQSLVLGSSVRRNRQQLLRRRSGNI